jgi:hypothetical protein
MSRFILWTWLMLVASAMSAQTVINQVFDFNMAVESAQDVIEVDDGYVFCGGGLGYPEFGGWTAILVGKINKQGNLIYIKKHGKTGQVWNAFISSFIKLHDNNFFVAGTIYDSVSNERDALMIKFNPLGDTIWTKKFGGNFTEEYFLSSLEDTNGNLYAIGAKVISQTNYDYFIVKTDSNGNQIWQRTYGNNNIDEGWAMNFTHDGNLIVAGGREFPPDIWDGHLMKIRPNGTVIWNKRYGTSNGDCAIVRVNTTLDKGFVFLSCLDTVINVGDEQYVNYVAKTDSSGNLLWRNFYNGPFGGQATVVDMTRELNDGSIVFCGAKWDGVENRRVGWLMKLDANGNEIWQTTPKFTDTLLSNQLDCRLHDFKQTSDNGFICAGKAFGAGHGLTSDYWLVKLDSFGCDIPGCQFVGIEENKSTGKVFIYPNPATNQVFVSIKSSNKQHAFKEAVLKIYDVGGKEIYTQTSTLNTSAYSEYHINISQFESGIYFHTVTSENEIIGKGKLIKQ